MKQASVILEEYDSSWPSKFEEEKNHLMSIAGGMVLRQATIKYRFTRADLRFRTPQEIFVVRI